MASRGVSTGKSDESSSSNSNMQSSSVIFREIDAARSRAISEQIPQKKRDRRNVRASYAPSESQGSDILELEEEEEDVEAIIAPGE